MPLTPKNPKSLHSYTYYFRQPHLATIDDRNGQRKLLLNVGDTLELSNSSLITIAKFKRMIGQAGTLDTDEFYVVGKIFWPFCSSVEYGGFLARWKKEVFDALEEREVPLAEIVRKVRLIRTNRVFPQMHDVGADGEFYCRYKGTDSSLIRLAADECDKGVAKAREHLLQKQHLSQAHTPRRANQRYTYGDCFCGIGGTANGAREAGLQPIWAFDSDAKCAELYRENFPFSDVRAITVDQFLGQREIRKVDVLHISPPCQTWSLAHTCVGQNDDDNTATIFTVSELVKRAKPRVVTLEQVPGFMWKEENKSYPSDAISADEQSVLWESFARFLRTRILGEMGIIRSGRLWGSTEKETPGQELPEMPRPTHGCPGHPFLPPHRSLGQAFENIDPNDRLHEKRPYKWPRPSNIVPTEPLHATLTCAVHIPYWDESRPLTKRELARIQSFPDSHVFGDSQVIGNAVPPLLARRVFESVLRTLRKTDGNDIPEVIELD